MNYSQYVIRLVIYTTLALFVEMSRESDQRLPTLHIRNPMLRSVYNKMSEEEREKNDTHEYWYKVRQSNLSEEVCSKFIQFHQDEETTEFLNHCYDKSDWLFTQIGHSVCKSVLSWFMSSTSINGLLKRGSMFVFSDAQLRQLLDIEPDWRADRMMDLGAGDGMVTEIMAKYYKIVDTTEMSSTMVWRLQGKGYNVVPVESWDSEGVTYDLISCLNLLDRCDQPMKILHSIHRSLKPGTGRAIVAVVLPFRPYVEHNSTDHKPTENLIINGRSFEEQATSFIEEVFQPLGFIVERFSRLPYLCEGDMKHSFYVLNDAIFVLKIKGDG